MKRFLRPVLIVLGVLGFTGYFAFSTFLFSPLEGDYEFDVATLVPRDVDLFVARADLVDAFDAELGLRRAQDLANGPFAGLASEPAFAELSAKYDEVRATIAEQLAQVPVSTHPLATFGGSDLGVAAYFDRDVPGGTEWVALGRCNWVGKAAYAALERPGLFGLDAQGITATKTDGVIALTGGQLVEPLYFTRINDVIVISNGPDLPATARTLERNKGQESFFVSPRYHDEIAMRSSDGGDDLELFVRSDRLPELLGAEGAFPDPRSQDFLEALLGRLVSLGAVSELAGALALESDLAALSLGGSWDVGALTDDQRRFYRRKAVDQRSVVKRVGQLAPADAFLVVYLDIDLGELLRQAVNSAERAMIDNLETEIIQPIFGYATIDPLISDLEAAFKDRIAIIIGPNRYPLSQADAPNDGRATLAWAIALWVDDVNLLYSTEPGRAALLNRLEDARNAPRLGLQGRDGAPGIYTNKGEGGFPLTEYWSPFVTGTGHVATGVSQGVFVVTNHFRMIGELFKGLAGSEDSTLAGRDDFTAMMSSGLDAISAMVWMDPGAVQSDLEKVLVQRAQDDVLSLIDWDVERPRIEKQLLAQHFPNEVWGNLSSLEVGAQLESLVLDEIDVFREQFRAERMPQMVEDIDRRLTYLAGIERALLALKLADKEFELDARFVLDTKPSKP
jgi:hypothetical protein